MSRERHDWGTSRFTGNMTCAKCGLLPLDEDDCQTECDMALVNNEPPPDPYKAPTYDVPFTHMAGGQ